MLEKNYIIERQFDSWYIKSESEVIKTTDKTVFEHNSSRIPINVRTFFDVNELKINEKVDIVLEFEGEEYDAVIRREKKGRTEILWHSDLKRKLYVHHQDDEQYPFLIFRKKKKNQYEMSISKDYAGEDVRITSDCLDSIESQKEIAKLMDINQLRKIAETRSCKPVNEVISMVRQRNRDPFISEYAKRRANGICQLCGKEAPFVDDKGLPFLETHHIIWLSRGGLDSINNTVALCPNCHRKMHILADSKDIDLLTKMITHFDKDIN